MAEGTPPPIRYHEIAPRVPDGDLRLPDLIPGDGPLELDIGFGRGASLMARAAAAPASRVIGIEIKAKWAHRVETRRKRLGLSLVRAFAGDAREILARSGPEACLDLVFVHFPDPWWKRKHDKRRVIGDEIADDFARLIKPGGALFVQTDVEHRAVQYRDLLAGHAAFELEGEGGFVEANPYGSISNREARANEDGLPVYRMLARRR